jgi:hypothetical protein
MASQLKDFDFVHTTRNNFQKIVFSYIFSFFLEGRIHSTGSLAMKVLSTNTDYHISIPDIIWSWFPNFFSLLFWFLILIGDSFSFHPHFLFSLWTWPVVVLLTIWPLLWPFNYIWFSEREETNKIQVLWSKNILSFFLNSKTQIVTLVQLRVKSF